MRRKISEFLLKNRLKLILTAGEVPGMYGLGYTDVEAKAGVFYIFPLFLLVRIGRFSFFVWNKIRLHPTWFDKQMTQAAAIGYKIGKEELIKERTAQRIAKRYMRNLEITNKQHIIHNIN